MVVGRLRDAGFDGFGLHYVRRALGIHHLKYMEEWNGLVDTDMLSNVFTNCKTRPDRIQPDRLIHGFGIRPGFHV